jgi:hypothetical protein
MKENELKTLTRFIEIYCEKKHSQNENLCNDCAVLLSYATRRLSLCPYDPKPKCKDCKTHCYAPKYRAQIKEVMKFSGMYMIAHGRLDYLVTHFLG